ncbi:MULTISPECIES: hypothetical protein [Nocardiaceae]|nr:MULTISPECIES: hypothetical protein [Rhodococcus]
MISRKGQDPATPATHAAALSPGLDRDSLNMLSWCPQCGHANISRPTA